VTNKDIELSYFFFQYELLFIQNNNILQVCWRFSNMDWVKINIDGITFGCTCCFSCTCLLRGVKENFFENS